MKWSFFSLLLFLGISQMICADDMTSNSLEEKRAEKFINLYLQKYFKDMWSFLGVNFPLPSKSTEEKINFIGFSFPFFAALAGSSNMFDDVDFNKNDVLQLKVNKIQQSFNKLTAPPLGMKLDSNFLTYSVDPGKPDQERIFAVSNETSLPWKINFSDDQKFETINPNTKDQKVKTKAQTMRIFIDDSEIKKKNKDKNTFFVRELLYPGESYLIKEESDNYVLFDNSTQEKVSGNKPQLVAVNGTL